MNNLKPMICPCCNAPLHSHICEYCGVEFEGYEKKEEGLSREDVMNYTSFAYGIEKQTLDEAIKAISKLGRPSHSLPTIVGG